jgi:hypothetical protein
MLNHLALVAETNQVKLKELTRVAAALQKQVSRDVAPIWNVQATVNAFGSLEDVPVGYWPMIVQQDVQDAAGVHEDKDGQPFALIESGTSWSLTASHECVEMLVDPFGNRLVAGPSPKPNQGRVEFLVEVCDPSEDEAYAYHVNGVLVSDFYTSAFFDPTAAAGVRYSFTGAITKPRQVLPGGYLSWHDPKSDHWFQLDYTGSKPVFADIGKLARDGRSLRSLIDAKTRHLGRLSHVSTKSAALKAATRSFASTEASANAKAISWRLQMRALVAESRRGGRERR